MDTSEINSIQERVLAKKEQMARENLPIPEDKELVKEAIGEKIEDSLKNYPSPSKISEQTNSSFIPVPPASSDGEEEARQKVNDLVGIALQSSIDQAVIMALKTGNAYLIDALHDILADKYYEQLKNQKLI